MREVRRKTGPFAVLGSCARGPGHLRVLSRRLNTGPTAAIPIPYELKGVERSTPGHFGPRHLLLEPPWVPVMADVDTDKGMGGIPPCFRVASDPVVPG